MITKETKIDQITITELGIVLAREATRIMEDGVELSKVYHRFSFAPGSDVSDQSEKVQQVCALAWTPEVVAAYQNHLKNEIQKAQLANQS